MNLPMYEPLYSHQKEGRDAALFFKASKHPFSLRQAEYEKGKRDDKPEREKSYH